MDVSASAADALARAVLPALLNGAWKGALLVGAVALLLRLLPRARAAVRHRAWAATMLLLVALPLAEAWAGRREATAPRPASIPASGPQVRGGDRAAPPWSVPAPPAPWAAVLLACLAAVAALRLARVAHGAVELRRLKSGARPLRDGAAERLRPLVRRHCGRHVELRESAVLATPIALGYLRPAILFPGHLLDRMEPDDLARVALHELTHLRRRDDWANLAQRLAEAVLFAQPPLLWVGRRLELERELACDELVLSVLGDGRGYAHCLVRLAEAAAAARVRPLAPGAAPAASQLARRVEALLSPAAAGRPAVVHAVGAGVAAAAAVLAATLHGAPGVGFAPRPGGPEAALAGTGVAVDPRPAAPPVRVPSAPAAAPAPAAVPARAPQARAAGPEHGDVAREPLALLPEPEVKLACPADRCGAPQPRVGIVAAASLAPRQEARVVAARAPWDARRAGWRVGLTVTVPAGVETPPWGVGVRPVGPRLSDAAGRIGGTHIRVPRGGAEWRWNGPW